MRQEEPTLSSTINTNRYQLNDSIIRQMERINTQTPKSTDALNKTSNGKTFQEILEGQVKQKLSFSKHANQRTEERNITLTQTDLHKLEDACSKAEQKGIKDALVVLDNSAFIINAPSRVVITALDKNEMKNNVFTNIDGALFI